MLFSFIKWTTKRVGGKKTTGRGIVIRKKYIERLTFASGACFCVNAAVTYAQFTSQPEHEKAVIV